MANGQLWYGTTNGDGGNDERIVRVNNDGSGQTTVVDNKNESNNNSASFPALNPADIGLDTARGYYFAIFNNGSLAQSASLVRGSLTGGAPTTLINYAATGTTGPSGQATIANSVVSALVVDPLSQRIFVGVQDPNGTDGNKSGIRSYSYDNAGNLTDNGFIITQASSGKGDEVGAKLLDVNDFAYDRASGNLFFTETGSGGTGYTGLFRVNVNTPTATAVQVVDQNQFPDNGVNGYMRDVEVDAARGHVFFSTYSQRPSDGTGTNSGYDPNDNGIWVISATGGANQTATRVVLSGAPGNFYPEDMAFDATTNQLYVETSNNAANSDDAILVFQLAANGLTGTLLRTITPAAFNSDLAGIAGMTFNDLPDVVAAGGNFTEGNGPAVASPSATVTDGDGLERGATVQLTTNFNSATDTLSYTNGNGITGSYNATTGTLTLSGVASAAAYQTAIRSITFTASGDNPTNFGAATSRGYTVTIDDGSPAVPTSSSNTTSGTFTVTGVNDAPVIGALTGDSVAYTQNATAVKIDLGGNATVTDADSDNFGGGTLTVTSTQGGAAQTGDKLNIANDGGITVVGNSVRFGGTEFATVSGTDSGSLSFSFDPDATPAATAALLHALTFATSSNVGGTRTIGYTLVDGDARANGGADTGTASSSVVVTIPNQPPVATASGGTTASSEQIPIAVDAGLTLRDAENPTLASARVAITGNFQSGQDVLAFTNTDSATYGNISGTYVSSTGVLTLSSSGASATVAQFEAALRAVTYFDTSDTPNTGNRTISFSADDGTSSGTAVTKTVSVAAVNDAPTATAPASIAATEDVASAVTGISFADVDAGGATVTATLSVGSGSLAAMTGSGVTVGGTTTARTLAGTIANINAFIAAGKVTFTTAQDATAAVALTATIDDGGNTGGGSLTASGRTTINVTAVNDAPVVTAGGTATYTEKGAAVVIAPAASVTDVDSADFAGGSLTVAVTGATASDQLAVVNQGSGAGQIGFDGTGVTYGGTTIGTVSGGANGTNLVVSLNGNATQAAVTALTKDVTYASTSADPAASRTVTFTVNDGDGGTATGSATSTVQITPVNDRPTLITTAANATFTEGTGAGTQGAAVAVFGGTTVSTVEAGQTITGLTFTVAGIRDGLDEVVTVDGTAIRLGTSSSGTTTGNSLGYAVTVSSGTATVVLTKSAGVTAAVAAGIVDGLRYQDTNLDDPSAGARTVTLTQIVDNGGGNATTTLSNASTITVAPVNDAPVAVTNAEGSLAYRENAPATAIAPDLTLSDPDSRMLTGATVVLSGGPATAEDVLGFVVTASTGPIEGTYDPATHTLALSGDGTVAQYRAALAAVTYRNTSDDPGTTTRTATFTATDGTDISAAVTRTIAVTAVNDAPTIAVSGTTPFTTPGVPVALSGIVFADVDAQGRTETATFSVGSGILDATSSSGVTVSGPGTTVIATGTLDDLNAFIVGNHLNFQGTDSTTLTVNLNDLGNSGTGRENTASATRAITVDQPPTAPIDTDGATGDSVSEGAAAGTAVGITASSTDADTDDAVRYALTANPNGYFAIDATTGVVTVSAAGATGLNYETATSHVITVSATDNANVATTSNFTIAVTDVAPTGAVEAYTIGEDGTLTVPVGTGVLANDTDPNGANLTALLVSGPAHASAFTLNANGSFVYNPNGNYNGTDSFTYTPSDGTLQGTPVTVTVTVGSVNDAPQGTDKTITTAEDTSHVFGTADFGFSDPADAGSTAGANALRSIIVATIPAAGSLTNAGVAVAAGGEIPVADIEAGRLVFTPAPNANGAAYAQFTFRVRDDGGTANGVDTDPTARTLILDVTPVNDAPSATELTQPLTVRESVGTAKLFTTPPTVSDVDSQTVTATLVLANAAAGVLTGAGGGTTSGGATTYTIAGSPSDVSAALEDVQFQLAANYRGSTSVAVGISDGQNGPQGLPNPSGTVSITIDPIPTVTGIAYGQNDGTLKAGESVDLVVTFSEPITATGTPTLTLNDGGTAVLVAGSTTTNTTLTFRHTVAAGQNTDDLAVIGISASIKDSADQSVAALSAGGINPDGKLVVDTIAPGAPTVALARDTGVSGTDGLTNDASLVVGATDSGGFGYKVDAGAYSGSYNPTTLSDGPHTVSVLQFDAAGNASADTSVSLVLDRSAPVLGADAAAGAGVTAALAGNLLANDTDASALHVVSVHYAGGLSYNTPASGTTQIPGSNGTLTLSPDGSYSYHPTAPGQAVFTETVADAAGNVSQTTLTLGIAKAAIPAALSFAFALTEARFDFSHGHDLMTAPDGTVTDLTGVGTITFTDGTVRERDGSPLVDDLFYAANNLDVWRAQADPDQHYAEFGWHEGRDPNAYFSTRGYLAANGDVAAAGANPLTHYDEFGWHEGRSPSSAFSAEAYRAVNPDVARAGIDPLAHYLEYGQAEDRFAFPGETIAQGNGHHLYGDFDATYYLGTYTDVAAAARAQSGSAESFALQHYLVFGAQEGRDPNAVFSTSGYLAANPDIAASGVNPLLHYEQSGWYEGRDPSAAFHTNAYLAANPDVAAAHVDPLQHYLQFGLAEGRMLG